MDLFRQRVKQFGALLITLFNIVEGIVSIACANGFLSL